jgi:hypothetical protein
MFAGICDSSLAVNALTYFRSETKTNASEGRQLAVFAYGRYRSQRKLPKNVTMSRFGVGKQIKGTFREQHFNGGHN